MGATHGICSPNEPGRQASLRRLSDDYLRDTLKTSFESQAQAFFQVGYVALLTALTVEEAKALQDHPSPCAAALAAGRLKLGLNDRALAQRGAQTYYSSEQSEFGSKEAWDAWARRVRQAVGWDGGPSGGVAAPLRHP